MFIFNLVAVTNNNENLMRKAIGDSKGCKKKQRKKTIKNRWIDNNYSLDSFVLRSFRMLIVAEINVFFLSKSHFKIKNILKSKILSV